MLPNAAPPFSNNVIDAMYVDFGEHAWILNHLPVELTVHDEALVASLMPATDGRYTTLQSLAQSQQIAEAAGDKAASEQGTGRQLLVSGRPARTPAFLKKAGSYRRPPLHIVPSTVTGQVRVQDNRTDNHPVLDRTLTLLELKRCQVCVCRIGFCFLCVCCMFSCVCSFRVNFLVHEPVLGFRTLPHTATPNFPVLYIPDV